MNDRLKDIRILAFDYGTRRIGLAVGNGLTQNAQAIPSIHAVGKARWPHIERSVREWQPDALVVGVPFHPDGTAHEMTAHCKKFARQLSGRFALTVYEIDERYTSVEAQSIGADDLDSEAARLIAEQYLRQSQTTVLPTES